MCNAVSTPDITGPDASGKAIARIICYADSLFFRAKRDDREHRSENLFLCDTHAVVHVSEDGWLNEIAIHQFWISGDIPSIDQLSTFLLCNIDVTLDLLLL